MNLKDYLYDISIKKDESNIKLELFYITKEKKIIKKENEIKYFLYIIKDKINKLKSLNFKIEKEYFSLIDKKKVVKITFENREEYKKAIAIIKENHIVAYEKDLPYELYYLIENDIKFNKKFYPFNEAYIDIETKKNLEIILISIFTKKERVVFVNFNKNTKLRENLKKREKEEKKSKDIKLKYYENEIELLINFQKYLQEKEFNLILGWNVIDFDFKVIHERCKFYGLSLKLNKFDYNFRIRINKDFFKESSASYPGTLILDGIYLLKANNISFHNYKLETVAQEVLKEGKTIVFKNLGNKGDIIEELYRKDINKLIDYNLKDSQLVYEIVKKLNLLELSLEKSNLAENLIFNVKSPILNLDVLYLKRLHKLGFIAPTNYRENEENPIIGAFVLEPIKGFHENILVFDFKSLYPTIIMTFNIDPLSYYYLKYNENNNDNNNNIYNNEKKISNKNKINNEEIIEAPNGAKFSKKVDGILPKIIEHLFIERNKAKTEKNKIKSYSLKVLMNSFYGAMGSQKCRFHNREIAEAITSFGQFLIKRMKKYFEDRNLKVVYGDTDSLFVKLNTDNLIEKGKILEKEVNDFLKKFIKENYDVESKLNLEFEKAFTKVFLATKKRYVGKTTEGKIEFTGLEAIRGDWTELAQNFQKEFIKKVFNNNTKSELEKFIRKYVKKLRDGKFDNLLIYKKKITKPLKEYTKTTPPHVKAARELKNFNGRVVEYVMTIEGPKHVSLINENTRYDYEHYINKQLKGAVDDFLKYLNINFEEAVSGEKQSSLNKFF